MANWSNTWDTKPTKQPAQPDQKETDIVTQAHAEYKRCENWEAQARTNFEFDYKFANGDSHNNYQWDNDLILSRQFEDKPCLTINKTQQHNLLIINDAKQNKPGIRIRPVGDQATFEGAQIYQELVYHIEYISNAENVYDSATTWQVEGGIGYWRVETDYIDDKSFDQEIYIRRIKDPRAVYLDPDINEVDGSDARFAFVFEDMPKDLFKAKYPDWVEIAAASTLGNQSDLWLTQNHIRVAEYFHKEEEQDKLVTFVLNGQQIIEKLSELEDTLKLAYNEIKKNKATREQYEFNERKIVSENIKWYKIAGNRIIDSGDWPGKYIPIVRLVGTETVINGILDRKGHTRALINAQQMYNYNTSANVEYGALQTKSPWLAPTAAIEGYEEYYKTANRHNHSYLPYNAIDDDGNEIPAPSRPAAPQASPAYVQQLQIANNEMMMASGQYQSQFGEAENAKSGVAINARQRQGEKSTYHFIDNLAIAVRYTGKIVIDLIGKVYDTARVKKILARDGSRMEVTIDPEQQQATKNIGDPNNPKKDMDQIIKEVVFNPSFGIYDIQADTGPSFATKRMETAAALMQVAATDKEFIKIGGDVMFRNMDFNGAEVLADRYKRMLPPNISGDGLPPEVEQVMEKASQQIEMLSKQLQEATQKLADKDRELTEKGKRLDLNTREAGAREEREDYKAETDRLHKLANSTGDGEGEGVEGLHALIKQTIQGMLKDGALKDDFTENNNDDLDMPEGAQQAPDGNWYVENPEGGWAKVEAAQPAMM